MLGYSIAEKLTIYVWNICKISFHKRSPLSFFVLSFYSNMTTFVVDTKNGVT